MNDTAYDDLIRPIAAARAADAGIDGATLMAVVKAIVRQESNFDPRAYRAEPKINDASRGLMQVLERTARSLGYSGPVGNDAARTGGLYTPSVSLDLGTKLIAQNLRIARGDLAIALSAYNAGFSTARPGDAKRIGGPGSPFVNQAYVDSVMGFFQTYLRQQARVTPYVVPSGDGVTVQGGRFPWPALLVALAAGVASYLVFFR